MTEPSAKHQLASSGLRTAFAGVVLLMWMFVGAIVGVIVCVFVAVGDVFPITDPGDEPARSRVGDHVYPGILLGGVAIGGLGYRILRPRLDQRAHSMRNPLVVGIASAGGLVLGGTIGTGVFRMIDSLQPREWNPPPFEGFGTWILCILVCAVAGAALSSVMTWRYLRRRFLRSETAQLHDAADDASHRS